MNEILNKVKQHANFLRQGFSSSEAYQKAFGDSEKQLQTIKNIEEELFEEISKNKDQKRIEGLQFIYSQIHLN